MSISFFFQRDLFGGDAALSGWPSDGFDEPDVPAVTGADLRASPSAALRVAVGRGPKGAGDGGVPAWAVSTPIDGAESAG